MGLAREGEGAGLCQDQDGSLAGAHVETYEASSEFASSLCPHQWLPGLASLREKATENLDSAKAGTGRNSETPRPVGLEPPEAGRAVGAGVLAPCPPCDPRALPFHCSACHGAQHGQGTLEAPVLLPSGHSVLVRQPQ